jgi:hypothetical protein
VGEEGCRTMIGRKGKLDGRMIKMEWKGIN